VDLPTHHTRGIKMMKPEKTKTKTVTTKAKTTRAIPRTYEILDTEMSPFERRGSVRRSPPADSNSVTTREEDDIPEVCEVASLERQSQFGSSESLAITADKKGSQIKVADVTDDPKEEIQSDLRAELESFLFNDTNKINKQAIKFIMNKWNALESRLYEVRMENNKLKGRLEERQMIKETNLPGSTLPTQWRSYASVVAPGTRDVPPKSGMQQSILLIKPEKETDVRNNDEIKEGFCRMLEKQKSKIRIKSIRKMRNKGLVAEFDSENDIKIVRETDLSKIGLKADTPTKSGPTIIVYDV